MDAKVRRSARLDHIDAEQFETMLASKAWQQYADRLAELLKRSIEDCTSGDGMVAVRRSQGAVTALRAVSKMPAQILEAMKRSRE